MQPSIRALRQHLDQAGHPPLPLTQRQAETRARILTLAQCLMAEFGAKTIKFTALAHSLRIAPATLRFHFADHDALLAALLARHLAHIAETLAAAPPTTKARRAAYRAATRTPSGALTEAHRLLLRDRRFLHPEERDAIDTTRRRIVALLAGETAPRAAPPPKPAPAAAASRIRLQQLITETERVRTQMPAAPTPQARNKAPIAARHSLLASAVARMNPGLFTLPQMPARASPSAR